MTEEEIKDRWIKLGIEVKCENCANCVCKNPVRCLYNKSDSCTLWCFTAHSLVFMDRLIELGEENKRNAEFKIIVKDIILAADSADEPIDFVRAITLIIPRAVELFKQEGEAANG